MKNGMMGKGELEALGVVGKSAGDEAEVDGEDEAAKARKLKEEKL